MRSEDFSFSLTIQRTEMTRDARRARRHYRTVPSTGFDKCLIDDRKDLTSSG